MPNRLILDQYELQLEYDNRCLVIRSAKLPPRQIPLKHISQLVCLHNTVVTTQLVGQLMKHGIDFILVNSRHATHSFSLFADPVHSAARRVRQYQWQCDETLRAQMARQLVAHKLKVSASVLHGRDGKANALACQLRQQIPKLALAQDENALRGMEGYAQRQLFDYWRTQLPATLGFTQRIRRPPPDPVNAVLSFTYTLVHKEAIRQLRIHGLDNDLGIYHRVCNGRESLACDIMEPLRPPIESWVVGLFCHGGLNGRHFSYLKIQKGTQCRLGKQGHSLYFQALDTVMPRWRRTLNRYAGVLARHIDQQIQQGGQP